MGHAYVHHEDAGKGTWAYVFDTGVFVEHPEFEGRAIKGYNAWADEEEHVDNFGHGSHVAGTIASKTYGIAKKATVVDVKILRGVVSILGRFLKVAHVWWLTYVSGLWNYRACSRWYRVGS